MQNPPNAVPTPKPNLMHFQDAVEALIWTMPETDFSVYIDPQGAGATVRGLDGAQHMADVRHPELIAHAVREAMMAAFHRQPPGGWARNQRTDALGIARAFSQALTWLPNHILAVGREGDKVWATVELNTNDAADIQLDRSCYSLADALIAAAALRVFDSNYTRGAPLAFTAPEAREAA